MLQKIVDKQQSSYLKTTILTNKGWQSWIKDVDKRQVHRNAGVPEWHIEHNQKLCYVNGELKRNDVQLFDVIRYL